MIRFARKINSMPKIVFSKTLEKTEWNNSRLVRDNVADEIIKLKQQPGKDLSIGGLSICQSLMKRGLIDEYWLLVQPVIWWKGRRLFDGLTDKINLKLMNAKIFNSGVVMLHYLQNKK